ncbi:MAG: phosphopentomutase [Planctomycetes bacterium]|nr:phosphopentomutase [Planctomycetota bacterium]
MKRVFLLVLDSLGVGATPDAGLSGDAGAHTLDHLVAAAGGLDTPRLVELGLGCIEGVRSLPKPATPQGAFGRARERSPGKDTSTGHWEMMGCELERAFPVYPDGFPAEIIEPFVRRAQVPGVLWNKAASGTEIIERFAAEHIATQKPIVYTSADSVFQVAAHESHFGLERLYECCRIAREILDPYGVGRVIARPFVGEPGSFRRTYNRRDYSLPPPRETVLDRLKSRGVPVVGVGKIEDIFAGRGLTESVHTEGNLDGMRATTTLASKLERGLVFVNLVDFDMLYGHRRDAQGYRRALEQFDVGLRELEARLGPDDLVLLTADHGNDPTKHETTDHTREHVPILAAGAAVKAGVDVGTRSSFADIGATVEEALVGSASGPGRSFLGEILDLRPARAARA